METRPLSLIGCAFARVRDGIGAGLPGNPLFSKSASFAAWRFNEAQLGWLSANPDDDLAPGTYLSFQPSPMSKYYDSCSSSSSELALHFIFGTYIIANAQL